MWHSHLAIMSQRGFIPPRAIRRMFIMFVRKDHHIQLDVWVGQGPYSLGIASWEYSVLVSIQADSKILWHQSLAVHCQSYYILDKDLPRRRSSFYIVCIYLSIKRLMMLGALVQFRSARKDLVENFMKGRWNVPNIIRWTSVLHQFSAFSSPGENVEFQKGWSYHCHLLLYTS